MPTFQLDDGDGYVTFEVRSGDSRPAVVTLDLYESRNRYIGLWQKFPDPSDRAPEWIAYLVTKGFPPISHAAAFRVADALADAVESFKKKYDPPAAAPPDVECSTSPG